MTFIKDGKLGYATKDSEAYLAELKDTERVQLLCEKHNYSPDLLKAPTIQCEFCWQAYLLMFLASMPPHLRDEVSAALQEFAHRTIENPGGYIQYDHPEIVIAKNAYEN